MKKAALWILVSLQLFSNLTSASADIQTSQCLLPTSKSQVVSLGAPLPLERLGNRTQARVGVLPFYFSGENEKRLSKSEEKDYLDAALNIEALSNRNVDVEVIFLPSKNVGMSAREFKQIYENRNLGWNSRDLNKSTWGFVKRTLLDADKDVDFSNLDSVILVGSNMDTSFYIAESMQFFRSSNENLFREARSEFFESVKTEDGYIDNAILKDRHTGAPTITHELLHNFGLTDLYGGILGAAGLSIMAAGSKLLNYEKAVLGWFPNENFRCSDYVNAVNKDSVENIYSLVDVKTDSIYLLKMTEEKAYIIEVFNQENKSNLLLYVIEQNNRPPIRVSTSKIPFNGLIDLRNPEFIGTIYRTNDFDLLTTDLKDNSAQLHLIPSNLINSSNAIELLEKSLIRKNERLASISTSGKISFSKKISIICVKGKKTIKVTAIQPVCSKGFTKKK
jgi:hypothetical protein